MKQDTSAETEGSSDSEATVIYTIPPEIDQGDPVSETPITSPKESFVPRTFGIKNHGKYSKKAAHHKKKCPKCDYQTKSSAGINNL